MNKKIKLMYFAKIRQLTNTDQEILFSNAETPRDLYLELQIKYKFDYPLTSLKVAINEEYCSFDSKIESNDTVVFIPPVAGG